MWPYAGISGFPEKGSAVFLKLNLKHVLRSTVRNGNLLILMSNEYIVTNDVILADVNMTTVAMTKRQYDYYRND